MTKSRILRWEIISDYPDEPNVITKIDLESNYKEIMKTMKDYGCYRLAVRRYCPASPQPGTAPAVITLFL